MLFWIIIIGAALSLASILGTYFRAKRAREHKLKQIQKRLQEIDNRDHQKPGD